MKDEAHRQAYEQMLYANRRSQELWQRFLGMTRAMETLLQNIANNSESLSGNLAIVQNRCGTQLAALQDGVMNLDTGQLGSSLSPIPPTTKPSTKKQRNGSKRPAGRPRASTSKPSTRKAAKAVRTKGKLPRRSNLVAVTKQQPKIKVQMYKPNFRKKALQAALDY